MSQLNRLKNSAALFMFLLVVLPISSFSQDDNKEEDFKAFLNEKHSALSDSLAYYEDMKQLATLKCEIAKERYFENQYSEYFTENLQHRKQTFGWQLSSTKWIFVMVVIIVLSGLFFSGAQFYHSIRKKGAKKGRKADGEEGGETVSDDLGKTEMELSMKGLKINSSVIGLIVLVVSMAFFYLYIHYVYPINQLNIDNSNFSKKELINITDEADVDSDTETTSEE